MFFPKTYKTCISKLFTNSTIYTVNRVKLLMYNMCTFKVTENEVLYALLCTWNIHVNNIVNLYLFYY